MPRAAQGQDEIDAFKARILGAALHIISTDGFRNLSMRKIARRIGVTATTIYNYYSSVDDLYFHIRMHGFDLLYKQFYCIYIKDVGPVERLREMIMAYVRFGLENPDFYDVMYVNRRVPKYLEVVGTEIEQVAQAEKEIALKPFLLVIDIMKKMCRGTRVREDEIGYRAIQLWAELNGLITLRNSRVLREVDENDDRLVERMAIDIAGRYCAGRGTV
jgi:AcrR family transcriptional regulator